MDGVPEESTHWQYFGRDQSATGDMRAFSVPGNRRKPGELKARIKKAIDSVIGPEGAGSNA